MNLLLDHYLSKKYYEEEKRFYIPTAGEVVRLTTDVLSPMAVISAGTAVRLSGVEVSDGVANINLNGHKVQIPFGNFVQNF